MTHFDDGSDKDLETDFKVQRTSRKKIKLRFTTS